MRIVGFLFFLLLLGGFALVALKGRQVTDSSALPSSSGEFLNARWRATSLPGVALSLENPPVLRFGDAGELSGDSGCNFYSGSYTQDGTSFAVGALRATRKACREPIMSQERALFDALSATRRAEFSGGTLRLFNEEDVATAEFERILPDDAP